MAITNGYASLAEVKAALKITDTLDDSLLEMAIESASREIDGYTNRYFYNGGTATKKFAASDNYITYVEDLQSVTTLSTVNEIGGTSTTWDADDYQLEPINSRVDGLAVPYTQIRACKDLWFPFANDIAFVTVVGVWGWSAVPIAVKQACVLLASRIFKRLDSPLGVAGFGDMGVVRVGRFDPDVEALLNPYRTMRNVG
jgi:hypothetical protein